MGSRVTRVAVEAVVIPVPKARLTRVAIEVVVVVNPNARISRVAVETVLVSPPNVSQLTEKAEPGDWLTLTGSYFGVGYVGAARVLIGNVQAVDIDLWSVSQIHVRIPSEAALGTVVVRNPYGEESAPAYFTLDLPLRSAPRASVIQTGPGATPVVGRPSGVGS